MARPVRVVQLNLLHAPPGLAGGEVLARWPSLAYVAALVATAGPEVSVLQAAAHEERFRRDHVDYRFVDVQGTSAGALGLRLAACIETMAADVLHVHGLGFPGTVAVLSQRLPRLPILLQDHADRAPRRWWSRQRWRLAYRRVAAVAFTALPLARPFVEASVFAPHARLLAIPESSSRFQPGDRTQARAATGVHGDPAVLWVGHLAPGKDPLTALEGIARAAVRLPDLQLWCAYGQAPMLHEVRAAIAGDDRLAGRVHLLGAVPHARVETLMQAADLFVSASRGESCGYAALEAMACGTPPILTDIPAFRALSAEGAVGRLWPCGDAAALADALAAIWCAPASRTCVRRHFQERLSFDAVGRRWREAYLQLAGWPLGRTA